MRLKALASISILLVLTQGLLSAQEGRGTISGTVTDSTGASVAGADIRVLNTQTGATASARSNESGSYTIPYLLPGIYDLMAEFSGFKKTERRGIEVRVGDVLNVGVVLEVGSHTESVQVSAATPLLESSNVSLGQVVDQRRLTELPIQVGNAEELVLLTPGVVNTTNLKARKTSFANAASQFSADGGAQFSNEFTIDGVPNTFSAGSSPNNPVVAFQPPQSAVREFKVQTSAFDATVGHTPGAVVNLITQSGTNEFHGEAHEWIINSALDAPTFFVNKASLKKQVYQDNRYGASIGGPLTIPRLYNGRNKTFFYYAWEANKWGKPTSNSGRVPTEAEKNGDLTNLMGTGQIYNPFSTRPDFSSAGHFLRDPFKCTGGIPVPLNLDRTQPQTGGQNCNIIPATLIDPVAQNIMAFYAPPNQPTQGTKLNYTRATNDMFDYYVHFLRFDHNFSQNNRMFVRLDYDHQTEDQSDFYGNLATGILFTRINRGVAVDEVLVLSPSHVLNLRYGLTNGETPERRRSMGFNVASLGYSPSLLALLDPKVTTFPNVFIGTSALKKPCQGSCTGTFSGFGNFRLGDGTITGIVHNLAATLDSLRGKHNLRYGADLRLYRSFGIAGGYDVSPGFQFLPTYTRATDTSANVAGQDFAAFLLGIPSGQMQRSASYATQDKFLGLFIQDDWKLTPKLTLNMGLRYEYESPETERFNRAIRGFDRSTPNPIEAQASANYAGNPIPQLPVDQFRVLGGLMFTGPGARGMWEGQTANFLPRLGVAYQITHNTVLRAGYGIFFDTIGINRSLAIQTGFTATTPIVPSLDDGQHFIATTANPLPNGLLAPAGASAGLTTNLGQSLSVYPIQRKQPYAQRWSFGAQRLLPGQFLLDISYVGNRGLHLPVDRELNPINPQYLSRSPEHDNATIAFLSQTVPNPFSGLNSVYPKTITRADLLRPYPEFASILETQSIGYSWYHALQLRAEKRFSHGYTLNVAYTWGKTTEATSFLNPADLDPGYSISANDRPHRLVISGVYELPLGRRRPIASNIPKPLDYVIGGWQLNGVVANQSGPPLAFGDVILRGSVNDIALPSDQRSIDRWFNANVFERDPRKQLDSTYQIRTFPFYISKVRGDGQSKWDLSLIKYFPLTERVRLQFRAETYDFMNHPNFDAPNMDPTNAKFGVVSSQGGLSREFQFALKLTF